MFAKATSSFLGSWPGLADTAWPGSAWAGISEQAGPAVSSRRGRPPPGGWEGGAERGGELAGGAMPSRHNAADNRARTRRSAANAASSIGSNSPGRSSELGGGEGGDPEATGRTQARTAARWASSSMGSRRPGRSQLGLAVGEGEGVTPRAGGPTHRVADAPGVRPGGRSATASASSSESKVPKRSSKSASKGMGRGAEEPRTGLQMRRPSAQADSLQPRLPPRLVRHQRGPRR